MMPIAAPLVKFAKTVLAALGVCAVLLTGVAYAVGPSVPGAGAPGLTAATVLATDGMTSKGRPGYAAPAPVPASSGAFAGAAEPPAG